MAATSGYDVPEVRGYAAIGRHDRERAFRRASRHSRRVRLLRLALPVAIVLLLGGTMLVAWLDPLRILVRLPMDAGNLVISGTKITMEAPKLSGYTRDGRWYEFQARSAAQDIRKADIIELKDVRSKMDTEDKGTLNLSAAEGTFDRKAGQLVLSRNILLVSSTGYEVRLNEAVIDTGTGEIISNRPVEVKMLQGTLKAGRLEVIKSGEVIRFAGNVVMNLPGGATSPLGRPADKP